jgi:hypothetical protein
VRADISHLLGQHSSVGPIYVRVAYPSGVLTSPSLGMSVTMRRAPLVQVQEFSGFRFRHPF